MEIALYCRSGAERPENRVERSGAVSGRCRKTMERSGARSENGAVSGGYRIRLEHGAAFSPAPLRSHALTFTPSKRQNKVVKIWQSIRGPPGGGGPCHGTTGTMVNPTLCPYFI